jgi:hypothetical protein
MALARRSVGPWGVPVDVGTLWELTGFAKGETFIMREVILQSGFNDRLHMNFTNSRSKMIAPATNGRIVQERHRASCLSGGARRLFMWCVA